MEPWVLSAVIGGAAGIIVALAARHFIKQGNWGWALTVIGLGTGGAGAIGQVLDLVEDKAAATTAYFVTVAVLLLWGRLRDWWRGKGRPVPGEIEMTQAEWDRLTPLQKEIVRGRLEQRLSSEELARKLGMTKEEVDEQFLDALKKGLL